MPCFDPGPPPGTQEYEDWLPEVRRQLDAFIHVVDYYYGKAGLPVPVLTDPNNNHPSAEEMARGAVEPIDPHENARVLHQILLHLDCDDVNVHVLHDLRCLLQSDPASEWNRYAAVLDHCFREMRLGFPMRPANDTQWRGCQNPRLLLDSLPGSVGDRKLRLFAVACCRRLPQLLADERCLRAVQVAEQYADGHAGVAELKAAEEATGNPSDLRVTRLVSPKAADAARMVALFIPEERGEGRETESRTAVALLRCIMGNPFRRATFSPSWRTETAVALAQQMYDSRNFSAMPILADAIQDAGCSLADILDHCRDASQFHTRGCFVVDLLLGKE